MSIRTKLVGAFLLVAILVPIVGVAAGRVHGTSGSSGSTSAGDSQDMALKNLVASQREQQAAVMAYLAGGNAEDRQRYVERSLAFQSTLTNEVRAGDSTMRAIAADRAAFGAAAEQILNARAAMDRSLGEMRAAEREITQDLNAIRGRYGGAGADLSGVSAAQRAQVADLLRATEGILQSVSLESALAAGYTVQQQETIRQQMDGAGAAFATWMRLANGAATQPDPPILSRVETRFNQEFTPAARGMMAAADAASQARPALATTSGAVVEHLDGLAGQGAGGSTIVDASGGWRDTETLTLIGTLLAFVLAVGLGVWFAGTITRPIRQLRNVAERVSTGDLEPVEINVNTKDEVEDLANAFRRMVTSIRFLMLDKQERDTEDHDFMSSSIKV